jgi:hypothetical protein
MAKHRGGKPPGRRGAPHPGAVANDAKIGKLNTGPCSTAATPGQGADDAEAKRRERLCAAVDRELDADRIFFRLNPDLEYRMRVTGAAELAEAEGAVGRRITAPDGGPVLTLVRAFHPKLRARLWIYGPPEALLPAPQAVLADLWSRAGRTDIDELASEYAAFLRAKGDAS